MRSLVVSNIYLSSQVTSHWVQDIDCFYRSLVVFIWDDKWHCSEFRCLLLVEVTVGSNVHLVLQVTSHYIQVVNSILRSLVMSNVHLVSKVTLLCIHYVDWLLKVTCCIWRISWFSKPDGGLCTTLFCKYTVPDLLLSS